MRNLKQMSIIKLHTKYPSNDIVEIMINTNYIVDIFPFNPIKEIDAYPYNNLRYLAGSQSTLYTYNYINCYHVLESISEIEELLKCNKQ